MIQVMKAIALKPWRGETGQDLCCSAEVVQTRAIMTMCESCEEKHIRLNE